MNHGIWKIVGASVQGISHRRTQTPCQDAYHYTILPGGALVAAIADGAGSANHAAAGSALAVQQSVTLIEQILAESPPSDAAEWQALMHSVFQVSYQRLVALAQTYAEPLDSFATTLSCVIVADPWLVIGQIGDGVVVVEDSAGILTLPVAPQHGEYANETNFLLSPTANEIAIFAAPCPVRALAASTDGLLRLAINYPGCQPFAPFFQPLFGLVAEEQLQIAPALADWLESERVCERTDDDKTLIVAVRSGSTPSEWLR